MSAIENKSIETIDVFGATLTRSKFVKGAGAMVVGFSLVGAKAAKADMPTSSGGTTPDATLPGNWLTIHSDGTITLRTGKV